MHDIRAGRLRCAFAGRLAQGNEEHALLRRPQRRMTLGNMRSSVS
jgi:hypothetical protein